MQSSYLLINGLRVHYLHWNLEGDGQPVILLHGLADNARLWELVAPHLVERGLVLLAPDLRGHGLTDKPDGEYSFDIFCSDLLAFIEACNLERPFLAGHAWGADLALDYAARFSFGPRAPSGLVLVDGGMVQLDEVPTDSATAAWEQERQPLAPTLLSGISLPDFMKWLAESQPHWKLDDRSVPILLANFEIGEDETLTPRLSYEHHLQILRQQSEFKTFARFERLRCPVQMVAARPPEPLTNADRDSLLLKKQGIALAEEKINHINTYWMVDTSHNIPLQRPAELAALIAEFTAAVTSSSSSRPG